MYISICIYIYVCMYMYIRTLHEPQQSQVPKERTEARALKPSFPMDTKPKTSFIRIHRI